MNEKAMAPHSSTLAWKIPWAEKPGGLQSLGSQKSQTQLSAHTHMPREVKDHAFLLIIKPLKPSKMSYISMNDTQ